MSQLEYKSNCNCLPLSFALLISELGSTLPLIFPLYILSIIQTLHWASDCSIQLQEGQHHRIYVTAIYLRGCLSASRL